MTEDSAITEIGQTLVSKAPFRPERDRNSTGSLLARHWTKRLDAPSESLGHNDVVH